ncbi:MAG TPA: M1 family aminopeptidase [Thermoanaerobaculia bacterium]|nr:M1 family aminopeptidase [Thermoanaerobaculia bacterium]
MRVAGFVALVLAAAGAGLASPLPAPTADPVYAALRAARPTDRSVSVRDFTLERDVFRFRFTAGTFELLPPIDGRTVGAVFVGEGSMELAPASESERRHLAFLTGDRRLEILTDRFESLVLLFTDATAADIEAHGSPGAPPNSAAGVWDRFLKKERRDLKNNLHLRLLQDLLEKRETAGGLFLAYFDGKRLPPAFALVDPAGLADWFSPGEVGGAGVALYVKDEEKGGYWYLAHTKEEIAAGRLRPAQPRADAEHYSIETTIQKNSRIRATTTIRFRATVEGLRVLPVALDANLRVEEASFALSDETAWRPVPFVQEKRDEDADLAILFPEPLSAGSLVRLKLTYEGANILEDAGDGNFFVGARESWYPNLGGFADLAVFDLTYRCPKDRQVVSVGELVEDRVEAATRVSVWSSRQPVRVAGFNYGRFRRVERSDPESGLMVDVYTNPGEPDFVRQINNQLENRPDAGPHHVSANADNLANAAMADGINTARVGSIYFGRLPQGAVSITQQTQAFFGQSWPTLIYLPYVAAFDATTRRELGLQGSNDFVDLVGPHEFAHQWWGHLVGWESYRDQWLSEGFAEFTAALVLQYTEGLRRSNLFWEKARRWILLTPRFASVANDEAGPITDGWRLSTWKNRSAGEAMIYSKGAYVLHMLRMRMRDPEAPAPDARFIALLQDFVATQSGKNPSTRDFQAAVERHMTPEMNAAGDGTMDWFFRQWVYGTEIPRIAPKLEVAHLEDDRYRIRGSVTQSGVSDGFRTDVPIYVETKGEVRRVGFVSLIGSQTVPVDLTVRLARAPERALVNALHDVLYRD